MKYTIMGRIYGGEHTIGTIAKEVADYWSDKEQSALEKYIFSAEETRDDELVVPKKYQLTNWNEIDDVMHEYALHNATSNLFDVRDNETDKLVVEDIEITSLAINKTSDYLQAHRDANPDFDGGYLFGQMFEKGGWEYELETDEPFDIAKLKVNINLWSTEELIGAFVYDGNELDGGCPDGGYVKGMYCWIGY
jgi:hypothetical protein